MSPPYLDPSKDHPEHAGPLVRRIDDTRGTFGMALFIATESMLFVMLFFAYYYVAKGNQRWKIEEPPKLHYSLPQLGVLLLSSAFVYWGTKEVKKENYGAGRIAAAATIILGIGYLVLGYFDYTEHLRHAWPTTDAYDSIFYTITTLHIAHLIVGLLMFFWLLFMAKRWEPAEYTPHRPYYNVALYWYFVTAVWIVTVGILYVGPRVYNAL